MDPFCTAWIDCLVNLLEAFSKENDGRAKQMEMNNLVWFMASMLKNNRFLYLHIWFVNIVSSSFLFLIWDCMEKFLTRLCSRRLRCSILSAMNQVKSPLKEKSDGNFACSFSLLVISLDNISGRESLRSVIFLFWIGAQKWWV